MKGKGNGKGWGRGRRRKERKGKERKGKERKGKERNGKERKGKGKIIVPICPLYPMDLIESQILVAKDTAEAIWRGTLSVNKKCLINKKVLNKRGE